MRFHTIQPSLFPEYVFAVVHTYAFGSKAYYRAECELCEWFGWDTTKYVAAVRVAHMHNESHRMDET